MDSITFIDSGGPRHAGNRRIRAKAQGSSLRAVPSGHQVSTEVLQITKLMTIFDVYNTKRKQSPASRSHNSQNRSEGFINKGGLSRPCLSATRYIVPAQAADKNPSTSAASLPPKSPLHHHIHIHWISKNATCPAIHSFDRRGNSRS